MDAPAQVILTGDIKGLGSAGDLVAVKPAYAQNFIVSKGLGKMATPEKLKEIADQVRCKRKSMVAGGRHRKRKRNENIPRHSGSKITLRQPETQWQPERRNDGNPERNGSKETPWQPKTPMAGESTLKKKKKSTLAGEHTFLVREGEGNFPAQTWSRGSAFARFPCLPRSLPPLFLPSFTASGGRCGQGGGSRGGRAAQENSRRRLWIAG
jgi:hypothetical protein